jgi:hypothetical protein
MAADNADNHAERPRGEAVPVRKLLAVLAVVFLIWWAVEQLASAAHTVHHLGQWLSSIGQHRSNK